MLGLSESDVGEIHAIYKKWIDSETGILSLNNMMQKLHSKTTPFTRKSKYSRYYEYVVVTKSGHKWCSTYD